MEDKTKMMESLAESTVNLSKISVELLKLKALEKSSDLASSLLPHSFVAMLGILAFLLMNLGLAMWLGEALGIAWLGFILLGGFYIIVGMVFHFFIHQWMKERINNFIIKQVMK